MEQDVEATNAVGEDIARELRRQRQVNYKLCKCTFKGGEQADVEVWERKNFVHRRIAARHMKEQRIQYKQPSAKRGPNQEQSYWKPAEVMAKYRQAALLALHEQALADRLSPALGMMCS